MNEATETAIPEGYKKNSRGHLVPVDTIAEIDRLRDDVVNLIATKAKALEVALAEFRNVAMKDVDTFCLISAEKYGAKLGGVKGNVNLISFDGRFKVVRSVADRLIFDERLQAAKALIDECLHRWSEGGNTNIRTIINDAFKVDRQGRIDTRRILELRRIKIEDDTWKAAMDAISESVQVVATKSYLRVYELQDDGSYKLINLDIAA